MSNNKIIDDANVISGPNNQTAFITEDDAKKFIRDGVEERIKPLVEKFENGIKTDKATLVTILTLFSALIMFLLGDIQILKTIKTYWRLVGFSLILLSSLLFFVLAINYVANDWIGHSEKRPQKNRIILPIVIACIFGLGITLSCLSNKNSQINDQPTLKKLQQKVDILSRKLNKYKNQTNSG